MGSSAKELYGRPRYLAEMELSIDVAARAFGSMWLPDHLQFDDAQVLESWTMATWLAARSPNVKIGHLVLWHAFRSPSLIAKMAATLQEISGGRFVLGYGVGWNDTEHTSYGYDFPNFKTRARRLEGAVQVVRALWNDSPANFSGDHYRVIDAHCEPRPVPPPPILVGGVGEKYTLPLVARQADWWNIGIPTVEAATHKLKVLRGYCQARGSRLFDAAQDLQRIGLRRRDGRSGKG